MEIRFTTAGDTAFNVEFGEAIDRATNARVMALHARLKADPPPGLVETVPTFRSLLVVYDPVATGRREMQAAVEAAAAGSDAAAAEGRHDPHTARRRASAAYGRVGLPHDPPPGPPTKPT